MADLSKQRPSRHVVDTRPRAVTPSAGFMTGGADAMRANAFAAELLEMRRADAVAAYQGAKGDLAIARSVGAFMQLAYGPGWRENPITEGAQTKIRAADRSARARFAVVAAYNRAAPTGEGLDIATAWRERGGAEPWRIINAVRDATGGAAFAGFFGMPSAQAARLSATPFAPGSLAAPGVDLATWARAGDYQRRVALKGVKRGAPVERTAPPANLDRPTLVAHTRKRDGSTVYGTAAQVNAWRAREK